MQFRNEHTGEIEIDRALEFIVISISQMNEYRKERTKQDEEAKRKLDEEREKTALHRETLSRTVGSLEAQIVNINGYVVKCEERDEKKEVRLNSLETSRTRQRGAMGAISAMTLFIGSIGAWIAEHIDKINILK